MSTLLGTHGRKSGPLRATDIKEEFYTADFDIPISRYLRPPGGKVVPNLPTNQRVKDKLSLVKYSDYYGARFWYLIVHFVSATTETPERYRTKNDGTVVISLEGTSMSYLVQFTAAGGKTISVKVANRQNFVIGPLDGDNSSGIPVQITDLIDDVDGSSSLPSNVDLPTYTLYVSCGYGSSTGTQAISYSNPNLGVYYTAYFPGSRMYLPWNQKMFENGNRILTLSVTGAARIEPPFSEARENQTIYEVYVRGGSAIQLSHTNADPQNNIVAVYVKQTEEEPTTTDVPHQTLTSSVISKSINLFQGKQYIYIAVYNKNTSQEELEVNLNNVVRLYKLTVVV